MALHHHDFPPLTWTAVKPWLGVVERGQSWGSRLPFIPVLWVGHSQDYSLCLFAYQASRNLCKKARQRKVKGVVQTPCRAELTGCSGAQTTVSLVGLGSLLLPARPTPASPRLSPATVASSQVGPQSRGPLPSAHRAWPGLQRALLQLQPPPLSLSGCLGLLADLERRCMVHVVSWEQTNKQSKPKTPTLVSGPWVTITHVL